MKIEIKTNNAPAAIGPYSQAIEANGFVFASGQIPVNPATGEVPEGVEAQAEQVMQNMTNLLAAEAHPWRKLLRLVYSSRTWTISQLSTQSMQNTSRLRVRHVPA